MPSPCLLLARGLVLMLLGFTGLARAETLVIAGDIWCPINCQPDAERPGILVELAQEIFAEAGIDVQYRALNWARTLHQVRRGELNAAIGAGVDDAPDFLYGATPVAQSRSCFYTRKDSTWRYTGLPSLAAQRLGVINDYSYGDELDDYIAAHRNDGERIQIAAGDQALALSVDKLMHGRADVVLENTWVIQALLARQGHMDVLREAGCRTPDVPIYLAFSPAVEASARHVALFEQGLKRYRTNGRLQALLRAYGVRAH